MLLGAREASLVTVSLLCHYSLFEVKRAKRVYQAIFLIHNFSYLDLRLYLVIVIRCYLFYFVWIRVLIRDSCGFKLNGRRFPCHSSVVAAAILDAIHSKHRGFAL